MDIVFVHLGPPFNGNSLNEKPLGGTETALIGVSRALAANPEHRVRVFTNTDRPGVYDSVEYLPADTLSSLNGRDIHVLVSIREWIPLVAPLKVRHRVLFSPDAYDQPFLRRALSVGVSSGGQSHSIELLEPGFFFEHLDSIFCVGRWQADTFADRLGFPKEKIFVTQNGYFPEYFSPRPLSERAPGLFYSSTPFRGLEHLLEIFPRVQQQVPAAVCQVYSGLAVYGAGEEEDRRLHGHLYDALRAKGVRSHGSVVQRELAEAMCDSAVMAYPNSFEETFCISVLEAQAAGMPVVTSAKGALNERVEHGVDGFLVEGDPASEEYRRTFVGHVVELLNNPELWERMSAAGIEKSKEFTYEKIAERWLEYFEEEGVMSTLPRQPSFKTLVPKEGIEAPDPTRPGATFPVDKDTVDNLLRRYLELLGFLKDQPA